MPESSLVKNQIVEAEITGVTADGNGVARVGGQAVFVPRAAPGDRLKIRIVKLQKQYAFGIIEEIIEPSRDRIEQDCPAYPACGGCVFRHVSYDAELRYKHRIVSDALRRIGGISVIPEAVESGVCERYRNKAQYPVGESGGKICAGFYASRSHRIVEVADCKLVPREFAAITDAVLRWITLSGASIYDEKTGAGLIRHIFLRKGFATGEIVLCIVINGNSVPMSDMLCSLAAAAYPLTGIVLNINTGRGNVILGTREHILQGKGTVREELCGLSLEISVPSFFQVNSDMAQRLYQKAAEFAQPRDKTVLDLYCGTGSIGLSMAPQADRVIGAEIVPQAVEDARRNASNAGFSNCEFLCMDASQAASYLHANGIRPQIVLLDPPRKGCDAALIETVARDILPERVVYISCDPSTLARDLKRFADLGYETRRVSPFDLFPRTGHVETVALLSKLVPQTHVEVKVEFGNGEGQIPIDVIAEKAKNRR